MDASYIPIAEARGFTTHWIKTGNEIASWFQNTPYFMKCFLLTIYDILQISKSARKKLKIILEDHHNER